MATFRIHQDVENENLQRPLGKEQLQNKKRTVLGVVNTNSDNFKNGRRNQVEKLSIKPSGLSERSENVKSKAVNQKPKFGCSTFQVFEDKTAQPTKAFALKNENKSRILKERKVEDIPPPPPVPMSPGNREDQEGSPELDVSMKSEGKAEVVTCLDRDLAVKELDYLNLTERLYLCDKYREDISIYLRTLQNEHRPRKHYMLKQPDINYNMRAVLVDWLVAVVEEYNMTDETLYLAVSYIDRFLSSMSVVRAKLQLVGTAAMFIAAKYEEIYPPDVKDFVYITDDTYTKQQVLRMEHLILRVLGFSLSTPTVFNFLTDYTSHYPTPDKVKYLAMYLCELSLLDGDPYLSYLPSEIATAALCVARAVVLPDEEIFPAQLQRVVDVHLTDIMDVIASIEATFRSAESCQHQATRDKFRTEKYLNVSEIPPSSECTSILSRGMSSEESR